MHLFFIQGTLAVIIALIVFSVEIKFGIDKAIKYAIGAPIILFALLACIAYLTKEQSTSPGWVVLFFAVGIAMWLIGSLVGLLLGSAFRFFKNKNLTSSSSGTDNP